VSEASPLVIPYARFTFLIASSLHVFNYACVPGPLEHKRPRRDRLDDVDDFGVRDEPFTPIPVRLGDNYVSVVPLVAIFDVNTLDIRYSNCVILPFLVDARESSHIEPKSKGIFVTSSSDVFANLFGVFSLDDFYDFRWAIFLWEELLSHRLDILIPCDTGLAR